MIILVLSLLWANPLQIDADTAIPIVEQIKTKDGFDVLWIRDKRSPIVRIELFFPVGMENCTLEVEKAWQKKMENQEKKLLSLGGYAKFSMQSHQGYAQLSVRSGQEKQGFRWLYDMLIYLVINKAENEESYFPPSLRHTDVVQQSLFGTSSPQIQKRNCQRYYDAWLSRIKPRFLLVGALEETLDLSFLDYFWPKFLVSKWKETSNTEQQEINIPQQIPPLRIYDLDRMGQVEISLLFPIPKHNSFVLQAYREILVGGFTSRINMSLRETHGWVYAVVSVLHYRKEDIFFEITTQCAQSDLPFVRDEILRQIQSMMEIHDDELQKVLWEDVRKYRERQMDGTYQISSLRYWNPNQQKLGFRVQEKEEIQKIAQEIWHRGHFFWIVTGKKDDVVERWEGEWDDFVVQTSHE